MASNVPPNTTCKVCSELYTDPRMLPCLHSFCKKCIEKIVEKQESKQAFNCPTCNHQADISAGGVDAIPQDIRAQNEVETKSFESKITSASNEKCDRCIRAGSGPAVSFCCNCCEFLCKVCKEDHMQWRKTINHELVEVGEKKKQSSGDFRALLAPRPTFCSQHPDENLKFYCETCETLICRDCMALEHNGHSYNRFEKVAEKEKEDLLSSMVGADEAKLQLEDVMAQRDKLVQQVQQRKKAVDETITSAFKELYEAIRRREEALLAKSNEISLGKTSSLAIENEELKRLRDEITDTCQLIANAVQTYTPNEILSTKKLMKAKLQALLEKFQETPLEPTETALMPTSLDVSPLVTQVATFGAVTGGSCPGMGTADIYIPRATVDKERTIKVMTRDEAGKPFPHGGENIQGSLTLLGSSNQPTVGTTTDNGDGTYAVSFTPTTTGEHELKITINNQPIKGSPFVISVHQERDYKSLSGYQQCFSTASTPWDVAIHENGDLYMAAYGANCVYVLTSSGANKLSFGTGGNGQGQFSNPSGIAVRGDVVYVVEGSNNRVQKLSIKGEHIAFIGEGQFRNPRGICLDPEGKIFVADHSNNRVQVFNQDGSHAYSITGSSTEGSDLSSPWGIALDAQGNVHVVSYNLILVRIFTNEGKYITSYGSGQFSYQPAGIAIDEKGYSFVTEYYASGCARLHTFDPQHQGIHSTMCTNSYFNYPTGVAIDKDGFIWVADSQNNRVKKL